jgi:carbon monoxide dehydrogenase subunit G
MDMTGEERINAPRDAVWAALNDPDILKRCIPGCQVLEMTSPTELAATVKIKIGPVSATFNGEVTLSNINAPESYTISGEGTGRRKACATRCSVGGLHLAETGTAVLRRFQCGSLGKGSDVSLGPLAACDV